MTTKTDIKQQRRQQIREKRIQRINARIRERNPVRVSVERDPRLDVTAVVETRFAASRIDPFVFIINPARLAVFSFNSIRRGLLLRRAKDKSLEAMTVEAMNGR
jgi:hypothetical protein